MGMDSGLGRETIVDAGDGLNVSRRSRGACNKLGVIARFNRAIQYSRDGDD
jgi:hypothetical protein